MPLPSQAAREAEANTATQAFQLALAQQGVATVAESLTLWQETPVDQTATTAARWSADAVSLILKRRAKSRALAIAWYRLVRALRTGRTVADSRRPDPPYVTLQQLRFEFKQLAAGKDLPARSEPPAPAAIPKNERIPVDEVLDTEELAKQLDKDAAKAAEKSLQVTGPDTLAAAREKLDDELTAREVDALRKEAHSKAGARQAASTQRHALNGARSTVRDLAAKDKTAIGFVRISKTGTPCGFCAMLISRGVIFYESRKSAGGKTADSESVQRGDAQVGDKYHDGCNCVAEPVFSKTQYSSAPQYALNRQYEQEWPRVTKGLYGTDALNAWRRYINAQKKQGDTQQAQAA